MMAPLFNDGSAVQTAESRARRRKKDRVSAGDASAMWREEELPAEVLRARQNGRDAVIDRVVNRLPEVAASATAFAFVRLLRLNAVLGEIRRDTAAHLVRQSRALSATRDHLGTAMVRRPDDRGKF